MNKKSIAIIPARSGSKRIPKKNIIEFKGKPMISYSILTALKTGLFEKVIVNTDDEEIAGISKRYGADIPFIRPKELADDFTSILEVIDNTLLQLKIKEMRYDYACVIYATAPLIQSHYIKEGFEKLKKSGAKYAVAITSMPFPIQRSFKISNDNRCEMFWPENYSLRSQDFEKSYQDAGQFYWIDLNKKSNEIILGKDSIPIILPRHLVQDIDTMEDLKRAEYLYEIIDREI